MRTAITIVLLMLLSSATVSAQADFLDKGEGGLEFALQYSTIDSVDAYFVDLGLTTNGTFEIDLTAGQVRLPGNDYVVVQPSVLFYPLKQKPNQFLNIGFRMGFELNFMSPGFENSRTESRIMGGGVILSNAELSKSVWLQPAFSVSFFSGIQGQPGQTVTGLSLSVLVKMSQQTVMRLSPSLAFADGDQTFSFTLGFILPEISE